jgi:integrase
MVAKRQGVAKWWQSYINDNNFVGDSKNTDNYKEAYLQRPKDATALGKWFVCFWVFDENSKKLVRKRIVISGKTIEERETLANGIIAEVNEFLAKGAKINLKIQKVVSQKDYTIEEGLAFFQKLKLQTLKPKSAQTYRSSAKTFLEFLTKQKAEKTKMQDFTIEQTHDFCDWLLLEKKLSNKSYNRIKGFCSGFFNEFKRRKVVVDNHFSIIKKLTVTSGKHRVFDKVQIEEMKKLCADNNDSATWFFLCFIYYTFMRPHEEARLITVGDIKKNTILVSERIAKTSKVRHVYIPPGLEKMIAEHKIRDYPSHYFVFSYDGIPSKNLVSKDYWYSKHRKYLEKMGIFGCGFDLYGWKHTGVCALYTATKDVKLVQEQCGHSDIKQTVEYLRDLGVMFYEGQIQMFPTI